MNQSKSYTYIIQGDPVPLARPRFNQRNVYDSQKHLKLCMLFDLTSQHANKPLLIGPLMMSAEFHMPLPKGSKARRQLLQQCAHKNKPDLSNLIKFVEDVASGLIYRDDAEIAKIECKKIYSEQPKTIFIISEMR